MAPIVTTRADVRLRDESDVTKRMLRWQRIALEAAKQSGRGVVPVMSEPVTFEAFLREANIRPGSRRLLFSERDGKALAEVKNQLLLKRGRPLFALVGSEGGWTDEELAAARDSGFTIITLGGRTLRAETAAIAVAVLLQHLAGDLT